MKFRDPQNQYFFLQTFASQPLMKYIYKFLPAKVSAPKVL